MLLAVYSDDGGPAQVAERMVDVDEGLQEWRYRHVKMVERTIGDKTGTGGSSGAAYLRATLFHAVLPGTVGGEERVVTPEELGRENPLAPHYSRFRVAERLLLTGHSHQAWPDVALGAQAAFEDAALDVDAKWSPRSPRPTGCATVSACCSRTSGRWPWAPTPMSWCCACCPLWTSDRDPS